jgi:hypothetical protein
MHGDVHPCSTWEPPYCLLILMCRNGLEKGGKSGKSRIEWSKSTGKSRELKYCALESLLPAVPVPDTQRRDGETIMMTGADRKLHLVEK